MDDQKLSSKESLELITGMIRTARGNVQGASLYFLLWGWIVVVGNMGQYLISRFTEYQHPYIIWLIGIPAGIYTFWHSARMSRRSRVRTHMDSVIFNTWIAFLPSILLVIFLGQYFNYQVTSLIMILTGYATWISGSVIHYKPLKFGAIVFWLLTPIALWVGHYYSPLIMTGAIVLGYLVPGYMLRSSK